MRIDHQAVGPRHVAGQSGVKPIVLALVRIEIDVRNWPGETPLEEEGVADSEIAEDGLKLRTRTPMVYDGKEATSFTIPMKKYATVVLTAPEP